MDLRGVGASDKPPGGYDGWTLTRDVSGVIRGLGQETATVVGHGVGGYLAWSLPSFDAGIASAIGSVGMPHPLVARRMVARSLGRPGPQGYLTPRLRPWTRARELATDPGVVDDVLHEWASPFSAWPSAEESRRYAEAQTIPFAAHASAEYHRWLVRSQAWPDAFRYARKVSGPLQVPTLLVRGTDDPGVNAAQMGASTSLVHGGATTAVIRDAGHFPHEEAPARFNRALLTWLDGLG